MQVTVSLRFGKGYIAHPYWPEMEKVINIQKESGINRVRSIQRREQALRGFLESRNMTIEDYDRLIALSQRPFYRVEDVLAKGDWNQHNMVEIVIPSHQIYGCLAQAASLATSSVRLVRPEQIRTVLLVGEFFTGKLKADGVWERFAVVTAGSGARLSNQRAFRANEYISDFTAEGSIRFSDQIVAKPSRVREFLAFAGLEVGVGASRKLGWGRFEIAKWDEEERDGKGS